SDLGDFTCEKLCFIATAAPRALVVSNVKHLVHTRVKCIGFKYIANLINEGEDDVVNFGMQGAITLAVKAIRVRPLVLLWHLNVRSLIKLRVNLKQVVNGTGP